MPEIRPMNADLQTHTCAVIDEYLEIARACVNVDRGGGSIWGYPAALLLFSATDAIGRGIFQDVSSGDARLDVLKVPPFDLTLSNDEITLLRRA